MEAEARTIACTLGGSFPVALAETAPKKRITSSQGFLPLQSEVPSGEIRFSPMCAATAPPQDEVFETFVDGSL
jgi:hypothetical protein